MNDEIKVTIYIPEELKKKIHRQAITESTTLSKMICKTVTEYLDNVNKDEIKEGMF
jgi:predicted transcriptional regulator